MIWVKVFVRGRILMLINSLFSGNNGHITIKGKALKETVFCVYVHCWTRTCACSVGLTPLPLCLLFFFYVFQF